MQRKSFLAACAASLLLTGGLARAQATKLRFAHAGPDSSSQHLAALEMARFVKEKSRGKLDMQVYPTGQLGNDATVIGGVRGGTIELMMAGSVNFAGLVPRIGALDLPFLFRGPEHAYRVLDGAVDAQEHPIAITHSAKFYEVQKHLTMTRHAYTAMPVAMNKAKFDALGPELQKVVIEAAQHGARFQRDLNAKDEARIIADLRARGMTVLESYDAAPFRQRVGDETRKAFVEKNGPQLLAAIDATN